MSHIVLTHDAKLVKHYFPAFLNLYVTSPLVFVEYM